MVGGYEPPREDHGFKPKLGNFFLVSLHRQASIHPFHTLSYQETLIPLYAMKGLLIYGKHTHTHTHTPAQGHIPTANTKGPQKNNTGHYAPLLPPSFGKLHCSF